MNNQEKARLALSLAKEIQPKVNEFISVAKQDTPEAGNFEDIEKRDIYVALSQISTTLADSFAQVKQDIRAENRKSWAGTAHEIREIVANLLRELAPDKEVMAQSWFRKETESGKPSQKQRAIYVLHKRGSGSTAIEVVQKVQVLDEMVGELVRSTYNRASDAAHTFETKKEVLKLLRYFEAFAHDLLDL